MRKRESEVRVETRRELGESESESRDQEREKITKILNTHATVSSKYPYLEHPIILCINVQNGKSN